MTKAFFLVSPDPSVLTMLNPGLGNTREFVNQGGLSRSALFNQVDASLERLHTSYIDVLQVHTFDPTTPLTETMKALHDLVQSGKVRYLGACNMRAWQFAEMQRVADVNGWTRFVSMQVEYSLLYRPAVRSQSIPRILCDDYAHARPSLGRTLGAGDPWILQVRRGRRNRVLASDGRPPGATGRD